MIKSSMRVAVCDDNPRDLQEITALTRRIAAEKEILCELTVYESSTQLLKAIQGGASYHTLLLDVMMDGLGGMELADALRRQGCNASIVFISSNREMALMGYEVSAVRYLAKPVDPEKLAEALETCRSTMREEKEILLPTASGQRGICVDKIIYAEAWGRGSRLFTTEGETDITLKISELEAMLTEQFVLCHRAYIVNMAFVQDVQRYELKLKNGTVILISKYRYMDVKERFFDYLRL